MDASYIEYHQTGSFSPALMRFLQSGPEWQPFISQPATFDGFKRILQTKTVTASRSILVSTLQKQYQQSGLTAAKFPAVFGNIGLLADEKTFTITTGHQLNSFTGPLYFIYKIVSAIKLAAQLKTEFPGYNFVPVYWMATEDHDFAEINHAHIGGKTISWPQQTSGATGRMTTAGIHSAVKEYAAILGASANAETLAKLMNDAYSLDTLASATRYVVNGLFAAYGLVVLDADEPALKKQFAAVMEEDILHQHSVKNIEESSRKLAQLGVDVPVHPREINFFYLRDDLRERIIVKGDRFAVLNTDLTFSAAELRAEIRQHPERFSPNVVMRPLYQETILPNLAYVGGGAEVIYWMQLKQNFDHYKTGFPILVLRNSALLADKTMENKLRRLEIGFTDLFKPADQLKREWVQAHTKHELSLAAEWQEMKCIFERLKLRAYKISPTLSPSTEAVKARLHKAMNSLEKKLMRAEKRNYEEALSVAGQLKDKLFPGGGLQERKENMGLYYVKYGDELISELYRHFNPLDFKFTILT